MTNKLFSELGLSPELLKAIDRLGFEQASPIQAEAIPVLMEGHDVVGQSMTGSGKTAAFAVPAIEKVDSTSRTVQALILCPTRELAVQVSEEIHKLAFFKRGIHSLPIYGGQSYERQFFGLKQGVQIVIGTPGRVMDHMRRGTLRLDTVRMMILDEADVMLDMGFREDIEFILQALPADRQTVFFSATMPRPIQDLIQKYAKNPRTVKIEQKALTVPTVEQSFYEVDRRFKIELLTRLIDIHDLKLGIIFCNTKRMVDELTDHLNAQGYSADRLHGDMSQAMRDRVMMKFRKSGLEFLVATDVAARGIDVDDVQVVFNYDLPYDSEDYVHRIGRTGRAGRSGLAVSFVSGREIFMIQQIERFTKMRIRRAKVPTPAEVEEARATSIVDKLRATLQKGDFKKQDHLVERLLEEGFNSTDIASALLHHLQGGDQPAAKPQPPRDERERSGGVGSYGRDPRPSRDSWQEPERFQQDRAPRPPRAPRPLAPRPALKPGERGAPAAHVSPKALESAPSATVEAAAPATVAAPAPTPVVVPPAIAESTPQAPAAAPAPAPKPSDTLRPPKPLMPTRPRPTQYTAKPERPASRRTPEGFTRLFVSAGEEMGVTPTDVVNAVMGETGLPARVVGTVDIRERHLFVDVASEHANSIIAKLNRGRLRNHKVKVKTA